MRDLDREMEVISHQDVGLYVGREVGFDPIEFREEEPSVGIIRVDVAAVNSASHHVIDGAVEMRPG